MNKTSKLFNDMVLGFLTLNLIFAIIAIPLILVSVFIGFQLKGPVDMVPPIEVQLKEKDIDMTEEEFKNLPEEVQESLGILEEPNPTKYMISNVTFLLTAFIIAGSYLIGSYHIYRFFKNIEQGKPFDKRNGLNLRYVGIAFLIASLWFMFFYVVLGPILTSGSMTVGDENLRGLSGIFNFLPWTMVGLMLWVIAEAFIQGNKLEEENKLTV